ncbi:DUF748 domain-containing protein [Shewanella gaetbuli]
MSFVRLKFSQFPLYQKSIIVLALLYALLCLILGVILPYVAEQKVADVIEQLTGRTSQVNEIRFNPFTYELSINKLYIHEQNSTEVFSGFDNLYINLSPLSSLVNLSLSIDEISFQKPSVNVHRLTENNFNFSDILALNQQADDKPINSQADSQPGLPFQIQISKIAIQQGVISLEDNVSDSQVTYPAINLEFNHFDSLAKLVAETDKSLTKLNQYAITLHDEYQAQLALKGELQLFPLSVNVAVELTDFDLSKYWQFFDEHFDIQLQQGMFELSSHLSLAMNTASDTLQFSIDNTDISLESLSIYHQDEQKVALKTLTMNQLTLDSLTQEIVVESIKAEQGKLVLNVSPTGADIVNILMPKTFQTAATDEATTSPEIAPQQQNKSENEPSWVVIVQESYLNNVDVSLGESVGSPKLVVWDLSQINLQTGVIRSDLTIPLEYQLSAKINQRSDLATSGIYDFEQQSLNADFSYKNLYLASLQPYLEKFINITIESGKFSTVGKLSLDASSKFNYTGQAWVDTLEVQDNILNKPLITLDKMAINQLEFDKESNALEIDEISFDQLFSRVIIAEDRTTNISDLLKPNPSVATEAETKTAEATQVESSTPSTSITINRITFKDSSAFFADNSLTPNFASGIELLNGHISQLSNTNNTPSIVDIAGKIDKYAPVTLKGKVNPFSKMPFVDLNLVFKHVELTSVNPYSGTYAGYYIDKGQINLDLNYQLEKNNLLGSNHVVINQLQLGKPSNSSLATSLPITLAVALLQDRHGVIDLGVDIEGDLDSPSFSFGSIIWGAFGNIITKAVTAPFSLLANLVGSDEPLNKVAFDYGQTHIVEQQTEHILELAQALKDRPLLIINVKGDVDTINDSQALAEQKLHSKLASSANISISNLPSPLTASQFPQSGPLTQALYQLYTSELQLEPELMKQQIIEQHATIEPDTELPLETLTTRWHIALYNQLKNNQTVNESDLGALAQERAKSVKSFLVEQGNIASDRIFVMESRVHTQHKEAEVSLELQAD